MDLLTFKFEPLSFYDEFERVNKTMFSRSHQDIHVTSKNVSVLLIIVLWYLTYVLTSNSETNNLAKCTLYLRSRGNSMAIKEVKEYNK